MHEVSLAQGVLDIVFAEAAKHGGGRVRSLEVEVGALSHVVPDSLRLALEALCGGTRAEGCRIVLTIVPGRVRCRACGAAAEVDQETFGCPACGKPALDVLGGNETRLMSFDLDDTEGAPPCK